MIFAIGLVMFLVGIVLVRAFGMPLSHGSNGADYVGVPLAIIGIVMMLISICIMAARWLP